jgi:hypothetical protein
MGASDRATNTAFAVGGGPQLLGVRGATPRSSAGRMRCVPPPQVSLVSISSTPTVRLGSPATRRRNQSEGVVTEPQWPLLFPEPGLSTCGDSTPPMQLCRALSTQPSRNVRLFCALCSRLWNNQVCALDRLHIKRTGPLLLKKNPVSCPEIDYSIRTGVAIRKLLDARLCRLERCRRLHPCWSRIAKPENVEHPCLLSHVLSSPRLPVRPSPALPRFARYPPSKSLGSVRP